MYNPVIVIAAYNRPRSLRRILYSISQAKYPNKVRLVISIDNDENRNLNIKKIAIDFNWEYGDKEVIYHPERLGLQKHILKCGDYASKYGSVIVLEDDLFVSPFFYYYAIEALNFYSNDDKIAGVSLYNLPYTETFKVPFKPLHDSSDIYFMQMAASLGQVWSSEQWNGFRNWFGKGIDILEVRKIPRPIRYWHRQSWKKYFVAYLIEKNKYFVFPKKSLTTNFNDPGSNIKNQNFYGQVPLMLENNIGNFRSIKESYSIYDAFSEISSDTIKKFTPELKEYDFDVDLYGSKLKEDLECDYVLTKKKCVNAISRFDRALKPHEMNIILNLQGDFFSLCHKDDLIYKKSRILDFGDDFQYFFRALLNSSERKKLYKYLLLKKIHKLRNRTNHN